MGEDKSDVVVPDSGDPHYAVAVLMSHLNDRIQIENR